MQRNNKVILSLSIFLFILFFITAFAAYPRIVWWLLKVVQDRGVVTSPDGAFMHQLLSSLAIAVSALAVGAGTYIISKKRILKEALVGCFVLIDVAFLTMLGWLAFLKYRLMELVPASLGGEEGGIDISLDVSDLPLFELGLAASVVVLIVAWIYPKKLEE